MTNIKTIAAYKYDYMQAKPDMDFKDVKPLPYSFSEFDKAGHVICEIIYQNDGTVEHKSEYRYNEKGLLIEETLINNEGSADEKKKYEYNEKGLLSKEFLIYVDESFDTTVFNYDDDGNLLEKATFTHEGNLESKKKISYKNGKICHEACFDDENNILSEVTITYNEKGNEVEIIRFDSAEKKSIRTEILYNEEGKRKEMLTYNSSEQLIARNQYEEDEKGQITMITEEDQYKYNITTLSYDAHGNNTEQFETNKAGELNSRITRIFDENNNLIEIAVMIDRHGMGYNQNYILRYFYEYYG